MVWTEEKLRQSPSQKLLILYDNAVAKMGALEADTLVTLIEAIGAPPKREGLKLDSPLGKKMRDVILFDEAKTAALQAATEGLAPMAVIDPNLQRTLGQDYANAYELTTQAGNLVAKLMRDHEWSVSGRRAALSADCVAKTAAFYVHIPTKKG